jgi:hypothetical protein
VARPLHRPLCYVALAGAACAPQVDK